MQEGKILFIFNSVFRGNFNNYTKQPKGKNPLLHLYILYLF
jgi:hypothetical protein